MSTTPPEGAAVTPDTIKISLTLDRSVQISIPVAGPDHGTDFVVLSVPLGSVPTELAINRISGATGQIVDTIKISDPVAGGGGA